MQFLYPSFLWALLSLAIPIIIHLFYFRKFKKVYFTNVKYLKEIKEETSNRNKLKNLLVLLSRCLALVALVFAFAQPFLPTGNTVKSGLNSVSVFVDNSFSMSAAKQDIPLLDFAKEKATSIVNSYSDDDRFQILTHDFEGKHQRFVNKEDALTFINEIKISPSVQKIDKVVNRQLQLFESTSDNKISYVISDFQKSITPIDITKDTTVEINLVPLQTLRQKNLSIDSVWFDGPIPFLNQNNKLIVKVRNHSNEEAEQVKLSFKKDGQEKPIGIRDIAANGFITDTVNVTVDKSGWQQGVVSVTDYPVQFDDQYYLSFLVPDTIKALFINEGAPNRYMDALFKGVKYFSLSNQNVNQLQYQQFINFDLIILHDLKSITSGLAGELNTYVKNGGKLLVFPGQSLDLASYNNFFALLSMVSFQAENKNAREVATINTEEFIFSDVYINNSRNLKLPKSKVSFDFRTTSAIPFEKLLTYRDGGSYLIKNRVGDGLAFVCASPLNTEVNDLVFNAEIFVPLIYKMAISTTKQKELSYTISNNIVIETENKRKTGEVVYKISNGETELIPGQIPAGNMMSLDLDDQIKTSGFFDLSLDNQIVKKLAFNFNRNESDMSLYTEGDLEGIIAKNPKIKVIGEALQANISGSISDKDKGIVLWRWFVIFALLFLAIEALLLRFYNP